MKKILAISLLMLMATGCETGMQVYSMSQKGAAGLGCNEIKSAFSAYQRDRQSAEALTVMAALVNADKSSEAKKTSTSSNDYYEQAKASANIALMVQGCSLMS